MKIVVPFDSRNGQVYLNALGETEQEALHPFEVGMFDIGPELIGVTAGELYLASDTDLVTNFPVVVPVSKIDGKPLVRCAGSSIDEAKVNLESEGFEEDDFIYEGGSIAIQTVPTADMPSLPRP